MNKLMIFGALAAVAGCCTFCEPEQEPNTLSEKEKAEGWQLLWDGKTPAGWVGVKSKCTEFPDHGWQMRKGVLTVLPRKGISNGKWIDLPPEDEKLGGGQTRASVTTGPLAPVFFDANVLSVSEDRSARQPSAPDAPITF